MPRRILLADDSVTAQNMGRKILTDAGYEVVTVNNGSAALKKIAESKPDVIVLDVYMPGYSGLEVCQKVKESKDTANVPVLLTVGKLEPFKQEEARRVRADAFIIKPFEASELLAAVGKLEDRMVAPSTPSKPVKLANSTMESFERLARESGPKYGDEESGWKTRLTIPSDGPKMAEPEPDEEAQAVQASAGAPAGVFRDIARDESSIAPFPAASETASLDGNTLPQDVTPDEIAALAAAAARVSHGEAPSRTSATAVMPPSPSATMITEPEKAAFITAGDARDVGVAALTDVVATELPPDNAAIASSLSTSVEPLTEGSEAPLVGYRGDEVLDAPSSRDMDQPEPKTEVVTVATAIVTAPATVSVGPRWIAEQIPVDAVDSAVSLEREMHKAFAAFAAADYGAATRVYQPAPIDPDDEPVFATMASSGAGTMIPAPETSPSAAGIEVPPPPPPVEFQDIRTQVVTPPPASSFAAPENAPREEALHAAAAIGSPYPFEKSKAQPDPATSSSVPITEPHVTSSAPVEHLDTGVVAVAAGSASKNVLESRAAAIPSEAPQAIAEEIASGTPVMESAEEPIELAETSAEESKSPASGDGQEIASIVDSMLAELRPKLVAEIARKLHKKE